MSGAKIMNQQIEFIARALYEAEDDAMAWEAEPEILKDEFRDYARAALALMFAENPQIAAKAEASTFPYAA
jgi:outer membrane lipopolysaccharide assembly protein LptE/RlpB